MVTDIPTEVRGPIDDEAARGHVITSEVTSTSLRKSADKYCAAENQRQNDNFCEAVFCFHGHIVTIELAFRQQVALGSSQRSFETHFAPRVATTRLRAGFCCE
jgi:hypothetical protein